jgi:hypothetical protein
VNWRTFSERSCALADGARAILVLFIIISGGEVMNEL